MQQPRVCRRLAIPITALQSNPLQIKQSKAPGQLLRGCDHDACSPARAGVLSPSRDEDNDMPVSARTDIHIVDVRASEELADAPPEPHHRGFMRVPEHLVNDSAVVPPHSRRDSSQVFVTRSRFVMIEVHDVPLPSAMEIRRGVDAPALRDDAFHSIADPTTSVV